MVYWHVERRSVCIYSQVTSTTASEVASMIEGLLRHLTSAEIDRQYTDTHGLLLHGHLLSRVHYWHQNSLIDPGAPGRIRRCSCECGGSMAARVRTR